jgi:hypothetical protein
LREKGENHCLLARLLGVSEGTVRYHLRCAPSGAIDGRCPKPFRAEAIAACPRIRTYRRVETLPRAQTQTDWGEFPRVDVGEGTVPLQAFVKVLSHSRKPALVWSKSEDELHWLSCHNGA